MGASVFVLTLCKLLLSSCVAYVLWILWSLWIGNTDMSENRGNAHCQLQKEEQRDTDDKSQAGLEQTQDDMSGGNYGGYKGYDQGERRLVLVGKTGVGKSAAGNTILGREAFESELSPSSMTAECLKAKGSIGGRQIAVIDTPGLFDTKYTQEEVLKQIKMCISLSAPGPHTFLFYLQLERFTKEEKDTVEIIQKIFGEEAADHTMVLFTHGDRLRGQSIESYIRKSADISELIQRCRNRYHVFNNEIKDENQMYQLLDKIENMIERNKGGYYTNEMFKRAEEAIEKEKERLLKELEEKRIKELEELRAKYATNQRIYYKEENNVNIRYHNEARMRAERSNEFTILLKDIGAAIGGLFSPEGAKVGAATGEAVGIALSAACRIQ